MNNIQSKQCSCEIVMVHLKKTTLYIFLEDALRINLKSFTGIKRTFLDTNVCSNTVIS